MAGGIEWRRLGPGSKCPEIIFIIFKGKIFYVFLDYLYFSDTFKTCLFTAQWPPMAQKPCMMDEH